MKARLSKKAYQQIHGATQGRIGNGRGALVLPLKRRNAWRMVPQARKVAKAG